MPERFDSLGAEAIDLATDVGLVLSPEQRLMADVALSVDSTGARAALEAAVVQPRQNGKSWGQVALILADLFLFSRPGDLFVWTAHRYKTTIEAFRVIKALIDGSPMLSRRVRRILESVGDELVELHDGTRLVFLARQSVGGRGLAGRRVVLDEAFALTPAIMGSLFPVMSRQSDAQIRYASSAALASSHVLRGLTARGRAGDDPGLVYAEWSVPRGSCAAGRECSHELGAAGCALDDRDMLGRANPEAGRPGGMSWEYLASERRAFSASPDMLAELVRERLGWEDEATSEDSLDLAAWAACGDPDSAPGDGLRLAVDVSPGLRSAAVVACGPGGDGVPVVEVVEHRRGAAWLAARVAELVERHCPGQPVGLDPAGPAGALILELEKAGVGVEPVDARSMAQACGGLVAAVTAGRLRHRDEAALNAAVDGAARRPVGDGAWKWSRRDSAADVSPLVAATVAVHLVAGNTPAADYDVLDSVH